MEQKDQIRFNQYKGLNDYPLKTTIKQKESHSNMIFLLL